MALESKTLDDILKNFEAKIGREDAGLGEAGLELRGDATTRVSGINIDSRQIVPGELYVCIPGFKADGHQFAEEAVKKGAAALVVERWLDLAVPQIKVENSRQIVGFLAAAVYGFPSLKLDLVGVTGTNGKTTVSHLVERIARTGGVKTGLIGTLGAKIGELSFPGQNTTPESTDIQKLLKQMAGSGIKTVSMEVSSHALSLGRVNGCVFQAAIFTNLTQDHLDYHQTMREYLEAKSLLFAGMKQAPEKQLAILNADDMLSFEYLKQRAACRVITYGIKADADFKAQNIALSAEGVKFEVRHLGKTNKIYYATPGKFSVYNALAAYAWGVASGYPPEVVAKGLREIEGVPGRFESVRQGQPFLVIVDYAHTPDGLENVLRTAKEITTGKLITVFGCGGDRDRTKRPLMGKVAANYSDYLIVTSDNPRTEDPQAIIRDILPGIEKSGAQANYRVLADRREAIAYACSAASPGDTVLIAGKGHEDYQIIGTKKTHFDDREEVRNSLRGLGYVE